MWWNPERRLSEADETSFDVRVVDRGRSAAARVLAGADGAAADFVTSDRWYAPSGVERQRAGGPSRLT
jgi:hypothetical protein